MLSEELPYCPQRAVVQALRKGRNSEAHHVSVADVMSVWSDH